MESVFPCPFHKLKCAFHTHKHTHVAMAHTYTHRDARLDTLYAAVYSTERHTNTHNGPGHTKIHTKAPLWLAEKAKPTGHALIQSHKHRQRDSHSHRLSERVRFSSHTAEALFSSRTNNNACRGSAAPGKTITEIVCPLCAKNQCNFRENGQKRTTHREIESVRGSERERERDGCT